MSVTGADGVATVLPLDRIGANRFEAAFHAEGAGQFRFAVTSGDQTAERVVAVNYPAALGPPVEDTGLRQLVEATGGSFRQATASARAVPERWTLISFWWGWLALALVILMAELAIRYTSLIRPRLPPRQSVPPIRGAAPASRRQREPASAIS